MSESSSSPEGFGLNDEILQDLDPARHVELKVILSRAGLIRTRLP